MSLGDMWQWSTPGHVPFCASTHASACASVRRCVCVCTHTCSRGPASEAPHTCVHPCECTCVCLHTGVCACMSICVYSCIRRCARPSVCVCVCVCSAGGSQLRFIEVLVFLRRYRVLNDITQILKRHVPDDPVMLSSGLVAPKAEATAEPGACGTHQGPGELEPPWSPPGRRKHQHL